MITATLWSAWGTSALAVFGCACRDWQDPREDRRITALLAVIFGLLLAVAAGAIWLLT